MKAKALVVDDSALMRKFIGSILEQSGEFEVMSARDGADALQKIKEWDPDVISLDINMPVMDGLTCLAEIMTHHARPVVMVSSLTEKGAMATLEALELGAVDYIAKPGGSVSLNAAEIQDELIQKMKVAARSSRRTKRLASMSEPVAANTPPTGEASKGGILELSRPASLVVIGSSTGGPKALEAVLTRLPAGFPAPIVVAQHMPATFTSVLAQRLDKICQLRVEEVTRLTQLEPGKIYIARGDADITVSRRVNQLIANSVPSDKAFTWHPSVERLARSALACNPPTSTVFVQLTGMGDDGAAAMKEAFDKGAWTIAESEQSAVVYGMPKALVEAGGATRVLPVDRIGIQLSNWVTATAAKKSA